MFTKDEVKGCTRIRSPQLMGPTASGTVHVIARCCGKNECSGKGGCSVPLMDKAWETARKDFEANMTKDGKTFGDAPAKG